MTPPKLTDEHCDAIWESPEGTNSIRAVIHAAVSYRDQQWTEMLAGQPPVGSLSVRFFRGSKSMQNTDFDYYGDLPEGDYELYTHPAPDQAAVMQQALEALESARRGEMGSGRIGAAIAALKQALGD